MTTTELYHWLDTATLAIENDQLTYPLQGSALQIYKFILARNPEQQDARRGLEHIVELHIEKAMEALSLRQMAKARSMLARARIILPEHPSIEPTAEQIRLIEEAKLTTVKLSSAMLGAADAKLEEALHGVADLPGGQVCRFSIWAATDGQARKIYRALSKRATLLAGAPTERLRAQVNIRVPAAVERMCFANE